MVNATCLGHCSFVLMPHYLLNVVAHILQRLTCLTLAFVGVILSTAGEGTCLMRCIDSSLTSQFTNSSAPLLTRFTVFVQGGTEVVVGWQISCIV